MRLWMAAVGRWRAGVERDLFLHYSRRLTWSLTLREVEVRRRLHGATLKEAEAALLLEAVPASALVVMLDERGENLSSLALAERIGRWRDNGAGELAFLIGGADGHGDAIRPRAALTLSLGALTWPHLLVRGLLAEQLYRAQQILAGHPYHRE